METNVLHGSCHCGRLTLAFGTRLSPADMHPRACDCSFCRKHGAAYVSDPVGTLTISEHEAGVAHEYRQGSGSARFLFCGRCGVLVAAVFEHGASVYGAANAACLDDDAEFGERISASPQLLDPEEKTARWLEKWVPDVTLNLLPT